MSGKGNLGYDSMTILHKKDEPLSSFGKVEGKEVVSVGRRWFQNQ
jgi:hypothetical protein